MSHPSPDASHPLPHSFDSSPPDSAALAAALHSVAQALLSHSTTNPAPNQPQQTAPETLHQQGETRCYYFSPSVLRHERELLHKYRAEDFRGLIAETHTLLVGLVRLMRSVHPDARLRGYVFSSLGCLLEQAVNLTQRMQNVYSRVELAEKPAKV